ncbi:MULTISPECIES: aminotransferase-like domain-containing protein [Streptomyces]|nr:PLP-dependent aminotransferase family protein [Streptomyces ruber]
MFAFGRGVPSPDLIDAAGLAHATRRALADDSDGMFGYGFPGGHPPLREWVAERHGVDASRVMITPGAMQAVALALETLIGTGSGSELLVDRPTYDMALRAVAARGVTVRQLDLGARWPGPVPAAERRCVYAVPTFRNPDGATMPLPERERLLEQAASGRVVVIEDDPYRELRFSGSPLPSFRRLGGLDRVVHVSSFSKTVCPGLRVGYVITDARRIGLLTAAANRTYLTPSMFAQAVAHHYVVGEPGGPGGLDRAVERMRTALAARADRLCGLLRDRLPQAAFTRPEGGYFLWLRLPEPVTAADVVRAARRRDVDVAAGTGFFLTGGEQYLRLCFAAEPQERMAEGVDRLAAAVEDAAAGATSQQGPC